jgi:hypothetical protein
MDEEKKTKIIKYSLIGFLLLVLLIFTLFLLNYAKNKNHDIEVLSGVESLRADLILFYSNYNIYPLEIKNRSDILEKDIKKECCRNLCLDSVSFNRINALNIKYLPCLEKGGECSLNIENPKAYRFVYSLRSR